MKPLSLICIMLCFVVFTAQNAECFKLPGVGDISKALNGDKDDRKKEGKKILGNLKEKYLGPQNKKVSKNQSSEVLIKKTKDTLYAGTKHTLIALSEIYEAVDNKENAQKLVLLKKQLDEANENDNQGDVLVIRDEINNAQEEISNLDIEKKAKGKEARKHMSKSLLNLYVATRLDKNTIYYSKILADRLPDEISNELPGDIKNRLLSGNIESSKNKTDAVDKLRYSLELTGQVLKHGPSQLKNLGIVTQKVCAYANANSMDFPKDSEIQKVVDKYDPDSSEIDEDMLF